MSMSKKDYELVARVLASTREALRMEEEDRADADGRSPREDYEDAVAMVAADLALAFKADNPNFRSDLFLHACNPRQRKPRTKAR